MRRFLRRIQLLFAQSSKSHSSAGNLTSRESNGRSERCDQHIDVVDQNEIWYQAFNLTKNTEIATRVAWAGTSEERRRGLLGRKSLDRGEGIYIVPTQWIHMFGMHFPIDVAFLDSDGRVLHMHHGLKPNRLSRPVWRAEGALELAAGTLRATGVTTGDVIELRSANDMSQ